MDYCIIRDNMFVKMELIGMQVLKWTLPIAGWVTILVRLKHVCRVYSDTGQMISLEYHINQNNIFIFIATPERTCVIVQATTDYYDFFFEI